LPWQAEEEVRRFADGFPDAALEVHLHDDRGLAGANALIAVRSGAGWVSCAVNGVGERCGITDTLTLLANLGAEGWREPPPGATLQAVGAVVQAHTRLRPDRWRPVVGAHATTHVARLHQRAVRANPRAYAWIDPAALGRENSTAPAILPADLAALINRPAVVSATELRHHRHGPGDRYLMLDDRVVPDARQYCIVRDIPPLDDHGPGHVDTHRHVCDSLFLFLGRGPGLTGLAVEVALGDAVHRVDSPASVFIPAGVPHSYRVLGGAGLFVNHVLSGSYNESLLDPLDLRPVASAAAPLWQFLRDRLPGVAVGPDTAPLAVLDSLGFLDLFLHLEAAYGEAISLDEVSACATFGEMAARLDRAGARRSAAEPG
jgi:2-isopropylmalate synthase